MDAEDFRSVAIIHHRGVRLRWQLTRTKHQSGDTLGLGGSAGAGGDKWPQWCRGDNGETWSRSTMSWLAKETYFMEEIMARV